MRGGILYDASGNIIPTLDDSTVSGTRGFLSQSSSYKSSALNYIWRVDSNLHTPTSTSLPVDDFFDEFLGSSLDATSWSSTGTGITVAGSALSINPTAGTTSTVSCSKSLKTGKIVVAACLVNLQTSPITTLYTADSAVIIDLIDLSSANSDATKPRIRLCANCPPSTGTPFSAGSTDTLGSWRFGVYDGVSWKDEGLILPRTYDYDGALGFNITFNITSEYVQASVLDERAGASTVVPVNGDWAIRFTVIRDAAAVFGWIQMSAVYYNRNSFLDTFSSPCEAILVDGTVIEGRQHLYYSKQNTAAASATTIHLRPEIIEPFGGSPLTMQTCLGFGVSTSNLGGKVLLKPSLLSSATDNDGSFTMFDNTNNSPVSPLLGLTLPANGSYDETYRIPQLTYWDEIEATPTGKTSTDWRAWSQWVSLIPNHNG